jgi:hypothetical protein
MEFNDYLNISDSKIRGVVILKREDGTIVFKKENMIVQNGRKFIRDKFAKFGISALSEYTSSLMSYNLSYVLFGNSDVITEYTMTQLVSPAPNISGTPNSETKQDISVGNVSVEEVNMFVKFRATLDRTGRQTGYTAKELGFMLKDTSSSPGPDLLFSRIVFDPITIGASEKYELEYYIYF